MAPVVGAMHTIRHDTSVSVRLNRKEATMDEREPTALADACVKYMMTPAELQALHDQDNHWRCPVGWCEFKPVGEVNLYDAYIEVFGFPPDTKRQPPSP